MTPTNEVARLLSRMIHEMGHTLGFYHEFEALESDGRGFLVGKKDKQSIMGYYKSRKVTLSDGESFPKIYSLAPGKVIDERHDAKVLYKKPVTYNLNDLRNNDAFENDPRQNGIMLAASLLGGLLRTFDVNEQILEREFSKSPGSSKKDKEEPKKVESPLTYNDSYKDELNRNSGFLRSIAKVGLKLGKKALKGAATGALNEVLDSVRGADRNSGFFRVISWVGSQRRLWERVCRWASSC